MPGFMVGSGFWLRRLHYLRFETRMLRSGAQLVLISGLLDVPSADGVQED